MTQQVFINLPVKNLQRSVEFFTSLGYTFNAKYTDANATCMIISDTIYVMLLVEPFFSTFIKTPLVDAHTSTEVITALNVENREAVDAIIAKAVAAGGSLYRDAQDMGFMYSQGYKDLDGHVWEYFWMGEEQ